MGIQGCIEIPGLGKNCVGFSQPGTYIVNNTVDRLTNKTTFLHIQKIKYLDSFPHIPSIVF